jgi:hypothetical protein
MKNVLSKTVLILLFIHVCILIRLSESETLSVLVNGDQIGKERRDDILEQKKQNWIIMRMLKIYKNNPKDFVHGVKKQRDRFIG